MDWHRRGFLKSGWRRSTINSNLGGRNKNLRHFLNLDFISHSKVQREIVANILDVSFVPSGSVFHVHSNHVVEHLAEPDIVGQLDQYHRILQPGGLLSIRCPNALGVAFGFWFEPVLEGERAKFLELGFPEDEDFGSPNDAWFSQGLLRLLTLDICGCQETLRISTCRSLPRPSLNRGFVELDLNCSQPLPLKP